LQIYTMEQDKRGLCPYDDKRYLLADLPDGTPNPDTHAYGHRDLAAEAHVEMDIPERTGTDLIIEQRQPPQEPDAAGYHDPEPHQTTLLVVNRELRFKRKNDRVTKLLAKRARRDSNGEEIGGDEYEQVPDGDENGELDGAQLRRAERAVAARPGAVVRRAMSLSEFAPVRTSECPTRHPNDYRSLCRSQILIELVCPYGVYSPVIDSNLFIMLHRTERSESAAIRCWTSTDRLLIRRGG
jgi:hypothetical protein